MGCVGKASFDKDSAPLLYPGLIHQSIDRENVVHLHNGVLLNRKKKKQWNLEIHRQMDGTRRNHSEQGGITDICNYTNKGSNNVFLNNKYDRGKNAFLDCQQQFVDEVKKTECLSLPYRIHVNEDETEENNLKKYFMKTIDNIKEEMRKSFKDMEEKMTKKSRNGGKAKPTIARNISDSTSKLDSAELKQCSSSYIEQSKSQKSSPRNPDQRSCIL
ncbi:beclin-1-like protein 1 [Cricetulus griseus]|uniref:Beclin-1-like protein 1 n=1 Tax=Cricetulus griseus TaxID=10029 RepID=A0A061I9I9_CRIGR|nr:beclin-1-like protein 1 [Cricetulus griseus]